MTFIFDDPRTWPMKVRIIAHDVARSHDRSTAVIGGNCPVTSVRDCWELTISWSCLLGCTAANWRARWRRLITLTIVIV